MDDDYDPELPTPEGEEAAPAEGCCGFPVDRTPADWPGEPAAARDGEAG